MRFSRPVALPPPRTPIIINWRRRETRAREWVESIILLYGLAYGRERPTFGAEPKTDAEAYTAWDDDGAAAAVV